MPSPVGVCANFSRSSEGPASDTVQENVRFTFRNGNGKGNGKGKGKGKGKVHPRTDHEGPEREDV
jgi:hypothetical protein